MSSFPNRRAPYKPKAIVLRYFSFQENREVDNELKSLSRNTSKLPAFPKTISITVTLFQCFAQLAQNLMTIPGNADPVFKYIRQWQANVQTVCTSHDPLAARSGFEKLCDDVIYNPGNVTTQWTPTPVIIALISMHQQLQNVPKIFDIDKIYQTVFTSDSLW